MTIELEQSQSEGGGLQKLFPVHIIFGSTLSERRARFDELVAQNPELCLEQTATGEIVMMLPTGGTAGRRSLKLAQRLGAWAEQYGGEAFDSSTLFELPNGARRGPDCSWVTQSRWESLTQDQRDGYPPLAPDFLVELRSHTDSLTNLKAKMLEYQANGVRLGWLIDPKQRRVYVYPADGGCQELIDPVTIHADPILPRFEIRLADVFS